MQFMSAESNKECDKRMRYDLNGKTGYLLLWKVNPKPTYERSKKTYRQPKDENKQGRESKRSKNKESESLRIWTKFDSNKKDKPSYTIVHT